MADLDDIKDGKDFRTDQPQQNIPFILKGCGALDWGMQSRLSRIFNPKTGKTVMLAFDHGYFQGPTTGLERIDINIAPLFEHADVLMCTRGILRSVVPPATNKPVVLRASGANSILAELSNEAVALSMDDAVRLNSCAVAAQVYIGSEYEHQSIKNIIQLVDAGMKVGMPTMAVTGVGKDMVRDQRYFSLATRIAAEMGAQIIKTYYVDMREVAWEQNYPDRGREPLAGVHAYYDILSEAGCEVDIWRTTYYHQMPSHQAIIDWVTATGLRPWLQDLTESEQQLFLTRYHQMLEEQYPLQENEQILLAFPRLFIVARRTE
ncbi:3-hydroxy-5-phosphonooxypentane-2,4-dione thiolase [Escherichia coli]|nr:3-hydroxy-5-phosphonooxypentane-2,4-dione thiolase [Escherichia coli]